MCGGNFARTLISLATLPVAQGIRMPDTSLTPHMPCPSCGTAVTPEFAWCPKCGAMLKAHACAYCGQMVSPGDKACDFCGAPANNK